MARILVLNQYYPPDTAATGAHAAAIAERLADADHDVRVITGQPSYAAQAADAPSRERRAGVDVVRIAMPARRGRETMAVRVAAYLRYLGGALRRATRPRADVVVCFHTPPGLPLIGLLAAWSARTRLVYIPQDIHPDILVASGFVRLPPVALRAWDAVNRLVLGHADRTVALGEGMRRTLMAKGAPAAAVVTIPLWAEPELDHRPADRERRRELGVGDDELLVLYAGNMGVMHPLEPVMAIAERVGEQGVAFAFTGSGVRREHWEQQAAARGLSRVRFLPYQPDEDFARLVAASDVALVALSPGMERLAVPSRSFAFLAAGRPVVALMSAEADVARLMAETGAGWHVDGAADLAQLLLELRHDPGRHHAAGRAARATFEARFRRKEVTTRYVELVDELLGVPPGGALPH